MNDRDRLIKLAISMYFLKAFGPSKSQLSIFRRRKTFTKKMTEIKSEVDQQKKKKKKVFDFFNVSKK